MQVEVIHVSSITFHPNKLSGPTRPKGNIYLSLGDIQAVLLGKVSPKNTMGWFTRVGPSFYLEFGLLPGTVVYLSPETHIPHFCITIQQVLLQYLKPQGT